MLFVPGDSERKLVRGRTSGADALILDLEDSVAPSKKAEARSMVAAALEDRAPRDWAMFVRINPFDTGLTAQDLAAIVKPGLDGILIPKADSAADISRVAHYCEALEARSDLAPGAIRLAVVATETPAAMFALGSYAPAHPRLIGMTWGAEDLATALGASANKEEDGRWTAPYQQARSLCLYAAAAAGVEPIETLYADFRNADGLEPDCRRAYRDGFTGRLAIHPDQVETINRCFSPSPDQIVKARRIVDAFAASPDAGTIAIDGKMLDIPHLKAAQRMLASV